MKPPRVLLSSFLDTDVMWDAFLAKAKSEIKKRFHLSPQEIRENNIADLFSLDTGAEQYWYYLQRTFDDEEIVEKLQNGSLLGDGGWPDMQWEKYASMDTTWKPGSFNDLDCCYVGSFFYVASLARVAYLRNDKELVPILSQLLNSFHDDVSPTGGFLVDNRNLFWGDMRATWRVQYLWLVFFMFCDSELFSDETWRKVFHVILSDSDRLYRSCRHTGFKKWNHHSHNMLALGYTAALMPGFRHSKKWFDFAAGEIMKHAETELYDDGGSVETCPSYCKFIYMHYRDMILLAEKNGLELPVGFRTAAGKQFRFIFSISQPDGTTLPINDSAESRSRFDFQLAKECFGWEAEGSRSVFYPDSQIAVMRSPSRKMFMAVDATRSNQPHWHGGKGGFNLWLGNQRLIVEAGMPHYSVADFHVYRDVDGNAHNVVRVDGMGDSTIELPYKWEYAQVANCSVRDWRSDEKADFISLENDGYMRLEDPVSSGRKILFVKDSYFLIIDDFKGTQEHSFEWQVRFPENELQIDEDNSIQTGFENENVLVKPLDKAEVESVVEERRDANVNQEIGPVPCISFGKKASAFNPHVLLFPHTGKEHGVETETIRDDEELFICKIITDEYIDIFFERRGLVGELELEGIGFKSNLLLARKTTDAMEYLFDL